MAGHRALEALAVSVVALLNREVAKLADLTIRPTALLVGPGAPQLGQHGRGAVILVHPYRVEVDAGPSVSRPTGRPWGGGAGTEAPGAAMRLQILVAASAQDPEVELAALGLAVQVLHANPVLPADLLDPVGAWREDERIQLTPAPLGVEEQVAVFAALGLPGRPALGYEARGVVIHP